MSALAPRTRRWINGWVWAALPVICSGCDRFWSPTPSAPTPEQVTEMRQTLVAQQQQQQQAEAPPSAASTDKAMRSSVRPTPLQAFPDWSLQDTAADALARIGAAAVPDLVRALRSTDVDLRWRATLLLGRIGPDAATAVPDLASLLSDPDRRVSRAAARALGQIGPNAAGAVPALMQHLDGSSER